MEQHENSNKSFLDKVGDFVKSSTKSFLESQKPENRITRLKQKVEEEKLKNELALLRQEKENLKNDSNQNRQFVQNRPPFEMKFNSLEMPKTNWEYVPHKLKRN